MATGPVPRRIAIALVAGAAAAVAVPWLARGQTAPLEYDLRTAAGRGLGLAPTPACGAATVAQAEGPFYTPATPERVSLREPASAAAPLVVEGLVLTPDCRPVAGAALDFWHCDENSVYDNEGFRYRGHQFTDASGAFRLETIRPPRYPGRTPHIHAKLQGPGTQLLTTQLYFPDETEANAADRIFHPELVMDLGRDANAWRARFDFVVERG